MTGWLAAFILAQALDTTTTCIGLSRPGGRELNPIMPHTCGRIVPIKAAVTTGISVYAVKKRNKKLLIIGTAVTGTVVAWNVHQLTK